MIYFGAIPESRRSPCCFTWQDCALVGRSIEVRLSSKADVRLAAVIDHHGPAAGIRAPPSNDGNGARVTRYLFLAPASVA